MSTQNSYSQEFTNWNARLCTHLTKSMTKATTLFRWEYDNDDISMMTWRSIARNLETRVHRAMERAILMTWRQWRNFYGARGAVVPPDFFFFTTIIYILILIDIGWVYT
ncbi:hypothetical protein ACP275_03G035300 [Erythranthe tilingii]